MPSAAGTADAWIVAGVALLAVVLVLLLVVLGRLARIERRLRLITDHMGIQDAGALPSDPLGVPSSARTVIAAPPQAPPTPMPAPVPAAAGDGIDDLLARGRKIQAIKLYREQTGVGLKEAKDAVEARARLRGL